MNDLRASYQSGVSRLRSTTQENSSGRVPLGARECSDPKGQQLANMVAVVGASLRG